MRAELKPEAWKDFWPEALPLMHAHRAEVADPSPLPLDVDAGLAAQLESVGALFILGARAPELVGYCIWYISPNLEARGKMVASQGPWYVTPEHRPGGLGLRLLQESISRLRQSGIPQALVHHWPGGAGERLAPVFRRMGGVPLETIYSIWLGG